MQVRTPGSIRPTQCKGGFFAYFNDDFIADHWTFNSDTMGTPAEVRKFFEDNWDACPPICYE